MLLKMAGFLVKKKKKALPVMLGPSGGWDYAIPRI